MSKDIGRDAGKDMSRIKRAAGRRGEREVVERCGLGKQCLNFDILFLATHFLLLLPLSHLLFLSQLCPCLYLRLCPCLYPCLCLRLYLCLWSCLCLRLYLYLWSCLWSYLWSCLYPRLCQCLHSCLSYVGIRRERRIEHRKTLVGR